MVNERLLALFPITGTIGLASTVYWKWDYKRLAHMLVVGGTGSGKTYASRLICGRVGKYIPKAELTVCDFKADDWRFLKTHKRYFEYTACADGLDAFFGILEARQQGRDNSRDFRMLVFDELASYLNSIPKKDAETAKTKLATLLMLGRGYNIHVLVIQQRGDSDYFAKARDNFDIVIGMGNLSKEQKGMLFSGFQEEMKPVSTIGAGYITDGGGIISVQVPRIRHTEMMMNDIRSVV